MIILVAESTAIYSASAVLCAMIFWRLEVQCYKLFPTYANNPVVDLLFLMSSSLDASQKT